MQRALATLSPAQAAVKAYGNETRTSAVMPRRSRQDTVRGSHRATFTAPTQLAGSRATTPVLHHATSWARFTGAMQAPIRVSTKPGQDRRRVAGGGGCFGQSRSWSDVAGLGRLFGSARGRSTALRPVRRIPVTGLVRSVPPRATDFPRAIASWSGGLCRRTVRVSGRPPRGRAGRWCMGSRRRRGGSSVPAPVEAHGRGKVVGPFGCRVIGRPVRRSCQGVRNSRPRPAAERGLAPVPQQTPAPPVAQPARAVVTPGRNF